VGCRASSQRVRALSTVDPLFVGSNEHAFSRGECHLKEVALNPRRRVDHDSNSFRRGGSVSFQRSWDPGSSPGVACLARADDRVMHPRFSLESGVGRARSQESVAGTGVLVELVARVNAEVVAARYLSMASVIGQIRGLGWIIHERGPSGLDCSHGISGSTGALASW
jgi:hypothetical protein